MSTPTSWQNRFRVPMLLDAQIAALDPDRGLLLAAYPGSAPQLYSWSVRDGALRKLTDVPTGVSQYIVSPNGRFAFYHLDDSGNEVGKLMHVDLGRSAASTNATNGTSFALEHMSISRSGNLFGYTQATDDGFFIVIAALDSTGALADPHIIYQSESFCSGPTLTCDGGIAVVMTSERTGTLEFGLIAFDTATGERIAELDPGAEASLFPVAFSPEAGDNRLLLISTETEVEQIVLWDPRADTTTDVSLDGLSETSVIPFGWSPNGNDVLLFAVVEAVQTIYRLHVPNSELRRIKHPSGTYATCDVGVNDDLLCLWTDAATPPCIIALDGSTGETRIVLRLGDVPAARPWRSVSIPTREGHSLQGWLVTPDGDGPHRTILELHGGPHEVQSDAYVPQSQVWVEHGFAYLTINYSGSTTFGREFERCISGRPGELELRDIAATRDWLIASGIGDRGRLFICGWSYGGYLALMALGRHPESWAGGIAGNAIIDWKTQYEESAADNRGYQEAFFGGGPDTLEERYRLSSPIAYADSVIAPVLLFHARNDARCPAGPVEDYVAAVRRRGTRVDVHWLDGGHSSFTPDDLITQQELMLKFCAECSPGDLHEGPAQIAS